MDNIIIKALKNSNDLGYKILSNDDFENKIKAISNIITKAFRSDNKLLICGNGGSAADAQHLAAEFSGRFYFDRPPLNAEALHVNSSYLTAVGNDYSYDVVFSRMVKAKGKKGDVIIGISTSGNSANVVQALRMAKEKGIITVGFTGEQIGKVDEYCDHLIKIPSNDTPRIQEKHILVGHIICETVESNLFKKY